MNSEQYQQGGWEKLSLLANEARTNLPLQEKLRSIESSPEMFEFLKDPVGDFGVPVFVDQDFVEIKGGFNNARILHDLIFPEARFWIYLKLDEDFLEMK